MTWFKVDDSFHSHPKSTACSLAALGLWTAAGSWSGAHLTDGFIPSHQLPMLSRGAVELADELVRAGLWRKRRGGYQFHDWADFNPEASQVKADREAAKERMRKLRSERKTAGQKANGSGEQPANVRDLFATPTRTSFRSSRAAARSAPAAPSAPGACQLHAGQSANNCGPCRSERLGAS